MASYVLTDLAGFHVQNEPIVNFDMDHYHILHQRLIEHEESLYGTSMDVQVSSLPCLGSVVFCHSDLFIQLHLSPCFIQLSTFLLTILRHLQWQCFDNKRVNRKISPFLILYMLLVFVKIKKQDILKSLLYGCQICI